MARHMQCLLVMPLLVAVAMGSVAQGNPAPGPATLVCPSEFVEDTEVLHSTTSVVTALLVREFLRRASVVLPG